MLASEPPGEPVTVGNRSQPRKPVAGFFMPRKRKSKPRQVRKQAKSKRRASRVLARVKRAGKARRTKAREKRKDRSIDKKKARRRLGGQKKRSKADRRRREMLVPTMLGNSQVTVRGSRQASQLGRFMSAVGNYLRSGDASGLTKFKNRRIAGHLLITDPKSLSTLAEAGVLQLESIYAAPEASS